MANATDSGAHRVHGTDPQYLIEKIIRQHIYDSPYWKEHCFGLDAATLVDQAALLTHCGGMYSEHVVPTPFLCLSLKLLQLSPPAAVVRELLLQDAYKYLRLLAALHVRLVGRAEEVYGLLDGLLGDRRRVRRRREDGTWEVVHVDEVVDELLVARRCCSVTLPPIARREQLVAAGRLQERKSALLEMMDEEGEEKQSKEEQSGREQVEAVASQADERKEPEAGEAAQTRMHSVAVMDSTGSDQAGTARDAAALMPDNIKGEKREERARDRDDRQTERSERSGDYRRDDRDRKRSRERHRNDESGRDERRHSRHSSSRRRRSRSHSPSYSRSPDRDRHRSREHDDDRGRRRGEDRHRRRKRSASRSRSDSRSHRRHRRRRSRS